VNILNLSGWKLSLLTPKKYWQRKYSEKNTCPVCTDGTMTVEVVSLHGHIHCYPDMKMYIAWRPVGGPCKIKCPENHALLLSCSIILVGKLCCFELYPVGLPQRRVMLTGRSNVGWASTSNESCSPALLVRRFSLTLLPVSTGAMKIFWISSLIALLFW